MQKIERWSIFELEITGPDSGNPFMDVELTAVFSKEHRKIYIDGFYDGAGVYRIRFMPDTEGEWTYETESNAADLTGVSGGFVCTPARGGNHGPVRVSRAVRFAYEDGTPYVPVGTTCYAWTHQGDALEEQTIETLRSAPFNKMRMCLFPKHYVFNSNEPELYPFEGTPPGSWDFDRFSPAYFRHLEQRISELLRLGVQADLILFHPYDRWGFSSMPPEVDDRYLRYAVSRLAVYRNVWWSFANEYDLMKSKTESDWDRFFTVVQRHDPYQHLRSIHNCRDFYDHGKPWVTHCSVQHGDLGRVGEWIDRYRKPVVVDECGYEGTINRDWGNLSARELVHRFWLGFWLGGYVGHGETYAHPQDLLWWSKGGTLRGESPPRIDFLRRIMEDGEPGGYLTLTPKGVPATGEAARAVVSSRRRGEDGRKPAPPLLCYYGVHQPSWKTYTLPEDRTYTAEIIDTWDMTITRVPEPVSGETRVELPGKPHIAVRFLPQA